MEFSNTSEVLTSASDRAADAMPGPGWSAPVSDYPRHQCIHQLFEEQASATPGAPALLFGQVSLTYAELNQRANQLARCLREQFHVGPNVLVGLCVGRSMEMVVAILAILKAGGAYVPLDPDYPEERLHYMLEDAQLRVVLSDRALPAGVARVATVVYLAQVSALCAQMTAGNLATKTNAESLAYMMYTSGSTGKPKGVLVNHRAVVRLVKNTNYVSLSPQETILQFAPISFDASTFEIWGCLLNGAKLAIMPPGLPSLDELGEAIRTCGVTTLWLTAGLFHVVVDHCLEALRPVRQLLAGGDALSARHVQKVLRTLPHCTLINGYGPTECTTFACCHSMKPGQEIEGSVPIGKPISNTKVYLLDAEHRCVPVGQPGEIYLGGDGLARGYHNQPDLTAERFVPDPFASEPDAKLYRTGDLGRWRPDGVIEFLGRLDSQVKISGFRIELGEVEIAVGQHPDVRQCAVVAYDDGSGDKQLAAYIVLVGKPPADGTEMRAFLHRKVPAYMVPNHYIFLESLPLSPNGKVDRNALPTPNPVRSSTSAAVAANGTAIEEDIKEIWRKVLRVEQVGVTENFFDLGGDSLQMIEVHSELQKLFPSDVTVMDLFEHTTVAQIAKRLSGTTATDSSFEEEQERAARHRNAFCRPAMPSLEFEPTVRTDEGLS